jgi:hypothetical protein
MTRTGLDRPRYADIFSVGGMGERFRVYADPAEMLLHVDDLGIAGN